MNDPHAPLQHHRGYLRLGWRVVVTVLIVIAVFAELGISAARRDAIDLLNPEAIRELLTVCGVVVVALVGVYSVMVDFVFWEGWMEGLPDPNHLFPDDPEGGMRPPSFRRLSRWHSPERGEPPAQGQ